MVSAELDKYICLRGVVPNSSCCPEKKDERKAKEIRHEKCFTSLEFRTCCFLTFRNNPDGTGISEDSRCVLPFYRLILRIQMILYGTVSS